MIAYEAGWREQMTDKFSWDLALFYNTYDNLITTEYQGWYYEYDPPPRHRIYQSHYVNGDGAHSYGAELALNYAVSERWRLYADYTYLRVFVHDSSTNGNSRCPRHQVYLRSSWNVRENIDFDLIGRYVDALLHYNVPAYLEMDMRLAWRPRKHLELAVVGQNLLQQYHYEWMSSTMGAQVNEVPRSVYGTVTWQY